MLIDFRYLLPKYNIHPKGILHIGGNVGEEFSVYMELVISKQIWIEPNPKIYEKLVHNISSNPEAKAYCFCVGDENKNVVLHESSNAGQSSSILDLGTHAVVHPDVTYIGDMPSVMRRIDSCSEIDFTDLDFLNIDIQGAELLALKGIGEMLNQFNWAYLEVNKAHLYVDCPLVEDIDNYLSDFTRVETSWAGNTNWGDALYIRKSLL